jgi:hypothetical protein
MPAKPASERNKKPWAKTKYKPELCDKVIKHHKQGGSMTSFVAIAGACIETLNQWRIRFPEFDQACILAQAEYQKLLESILFAKMSGRSLEGFDPKKSDTACLIFALKTRCYKDYSEKNKVDIGTGNSITINYDREK